MCAACDALGLSHPEAVPQSADKPSLGFVQAGAQITRTNSSWANDIGQATNVTFAFRSTAPGYDDGVAGVFARLNPQQMAVALQSFQAWADVARISFNRVGTGTSGEAAYSDNATVLVGALNNSETWYRGFAYLPGEDGVPGNRAATAEDGDVTINNFWDFIRAPALWNRGFLVLTHEIGHAIGLSHPGDYNRAPGVEPTYAEHAEFAEDTVQYSIMSYFAEQNTGADYHGFYAAAPQLYDIAAAQRLYGANMTTRTGDTVYGFNSTAQRAWYGITSASAPSIFAVWDAGGTDTFDFSGYAQNARIDLGQNRFSDVGGLRGNISIAQGVVIENAIGGSGADSITGNAAANRLTGNAGNDSLMGLDGKDTLDGGAGSDRLDGGLGEDTAVFSGSAKVTASLITHQAVIGSFTDTLVSIENLTGGSAGDSLTGDNFSNVLTGEGGADSLDGGGRVDRLDGGAGADVLKGGGGGDVFVFDMVSDSPIAARARDLIVDLAKADTIDLSLIDANSGLAGDQAFTLVSKFTHHAGELRVIWRADLGESLLQVDINGDGKPDMIVRLAGDQSGLRPLRALAGTSQRTSRPIRSAVDASCGRGSPPSSSGRMRAASALPSSTPHWSKLLIPHNTPSTKTLCS